jgi:hypothetical protein
MDCLRLVAAFAAILRAGRGLGVPCGHVIPRPGLLAFYGRAEKAFAVALAGFTVKYGCVILKKGVIPL